MAKRATKKQLVDLGPDEVVVSKSSFRELLLFIQEDQQKRLKLLDLVSRQMTAITGELRTGPPLTHFVSEGRVLPIKKRPGTTVTNKKARRKSHY